jgi:superfamily I DNA and/or RNA helicase
MAEWNVSLEQSRQRSLYAFLLQMVDVVGATCIGINTNEDFRDIPFDVVIVDESGQIQLHNVMVPLSRAGKAILVGDHKQLPPIVQDELRSELEQRMVRTDLMEKSWFEHLWDRAPADRKIMLDTQFRCPATISDFISAQFYDGLYHAGKGMREKQPLSGLSNSTLCLIDTSGLPVSQRQEQSASGNRFCGNRTETELVVNVLVQALQANPWLAERNEIGIIVPLAAHVAEIRRAIRQRARTEPLLAELTTPLTELVASVDSFQGQERDLVIMAFGRSNPRAGVGFLADWRRLNVGMTRAKRQLVLIGDMSTLAGRPMKPRDGYSRDAAFKGAMKALVAHVRSVGDYQPARHWLAEGSRT